MQLKLFSILLFSTVFVLLSSLFLTESIAFAQTSNQSYNTTQDPKLTVELAAIQITANTEGKLQTVTIPTSQLLFNLIPHFDNKGNYLNFDISLRQDLTDFYKQVGPRSELKTVFVYPIFTQAAYSENGFYYYYKGKCDSSCLTVVIPKLAGYYSASGYASTVLTLLGYPFVTDVDIDINPDILKQYDRIIILHNEYVTKKEFDAITSHPDVIFLYPNALYAEVKADYTSNTITLVRGHGYPDNHIRNGFDWRDDNSKYEYNVFCDNWAFYHSKDNFVMLNCYPEYKILYGKEMLTLLQVADPTLLLEDTSNWLRYSTPQYAHVMLADYDIDGTYVPPWVTNPAIMMENGEITKSEFLIMLDYLYKNNIIR